ncbi:MAG: hypothetical protein K9I85_16110 [Saprospiraceae bacterium]|nr:hypothetical protein [Saprospiraceae bacterium]
MKPAPESIRNFMQTDQSCLDRFRALWQIIKDQWKAWRATKGWNEEAQILLEILGFVWRHILMIILILIPILLLWMMDQGRDLILNLFQPRGIGVNLSDYIRIVWLLGMFVLQAYAIWVIPNFFIQAEIKRKQEMDFLRSKGLRADQLPFGGTISMSSNFLRILAILPFMLYGLTFALRVQVDPSWKIGYWITNGLITVALLLGGICLAYGLKRIRQIVWILIGVIIFIPIGFAMFLGMSPENSEFAYALLGNSLFICALLLFAIFHRWERRFDEVEDPRQLNQLSWIATSIYKLVGTVVLFIALLLIFWPNTMRMATIPVLIFFVAAYILLINLITYRVKLFSPAKKFGVAILVIVLLLLMNLRPSKGHYVHLVDDRMEQPRSSYATYQTAWLTERLDQDTACAPVFYLVSGEGGGSRAAYWTSRLLGKLDSVSNYRFADHLFALSTVSGSSAGTSAWYKLLRFKEIRHLDDARMDSIINRFSERTFGHNFVSGGIIDVVTRDFFKMFLLKTWRSDRNLRLQEEENYGFLFGLGRQSLKLRNTYKRGSNHVDSLQLPGGKGRKIPNLHFTGLPELYHRPTGGVETRWPLLLFNTTHMRTGRRGVLSPVALEAGTFIDAIDVISEMESQSKDLDALKGKTIALGTANNMSELFPVFSAFSYVDGVGNFMDGGAYENKGLTTMLEVYSAMRSQLDSLCPNARIVVLAMENGNASGELPRTPLHQSPAMLSQAASAPFTSQTEAARKRAIRLFGSDNPDQLIFMSLFDHPVGSQIPLARDLSRVSIRLMDQAAAVEVDQTLDMLRQVDPGMFDRTAVVE